MANIVDFTKNPYPDDRLKLDICPKCGRMGHLVADPLVDGQCVCIHKGKYSQKAFIATDRCCLENGAVAP